MRASPEQIAILDKCLQTWSYFSQQDVAVGEIGEFLTLIGRAGQGRATPEDWHSEIADVIIMMQQMAHAHGYEQVMAQIDYKMNRINGRVDDWVKKQNECRHCRTNSIAYSLDRRCLDCDAVVPYGSQNFGTYGSAHAHPGVSCAACIGGNCTSNAGCELWSEDRK